MQERERNKGRYLFMQRGKEREMNPLGNSPLLYYFCYCYFLGVVGWGGCTTNTSPHLLLVVQCMLLWDLWFCFLDLQLETKFCRHTTTHNNIFNLYFPKHSHQSVSQLGTHTHLQQAQIRAYLEFGVGYSTHLYPPQCQLHFLLFNVSRFFH